MSENDEGLAHDHRLVARHRWLIANRDVRSAQACLDAVDPIPETAAYHCQQATEKLIKGLLVLARVPFRKTHDLEVLRDLVVPRFVELADVIDRLLRSLTGVTYSAILTWEDSSCPRPKNCEAH